MKSLHRHSDSQLPSARTSDPIILLMLLIRHDPLGNRNSISIKNKDLTTMGLSPQLI